MFPEASPSAVVDSPSDENANVRLKTTNQSKSNAFHVISKRDITLKKAIGSTDRAEISQGSQLMPPSTANNSSTRIVLKKSPSFFLKSARHNQLPLQETTTAQNRVPANSVETLPPGAKAGSSNATGLKANASSSAQVSNQMAGMHAQKHLHYF